MKRSKLHSILVMVGSTVASLALMAGTISIQTMCAVWYHQPKVPQDMKKFIK